MTVVDFTEVKLKKLIHDYSTYGDTFISQSMSEILVLYTENMIDIEWEDGLPIPICRYDGDEVVFAGEGE